MSKSQELNALPASEQARLIREKKASAVEVLDAHLDAVATFNPKVNAVVTLVADEARAAARRADEAVARGENLGPLHGVPIGIKDVTPTAGIRTTYGSPLHVNNVPKEDAAVVERLRAAGAIVIGKTNTPEFAAGANTVNPVFGATRNPWNLALTVAGSTGGGGAALATGMIALAEGTDFGGSLRVPAAFCGVVGLRPTPGLTPSYPVPLPFDFGRVHGPMARTADDVALMLDAMAGLSTQSPISVQPPWPGAAAAMAEAKPPDKLKIAYASDIAGVGFDPEVESICRAAATQLSEVGARVDHSDFSLADGREAYLALRGEWMVGQYLDHIETREKFGPNLRGNIEAGLKLGVREIAAAERKRAELWHRCRLLFDEVDFLLTPTAPVPPFPVEQNYPESIAGKTMATYIDWIAPTFLITMCALPAVSVPCGLTASGLPVGLQIVGSRFSEPNILALAKIVQTMLPIGWPPLVTKVE
jgi:amidase